MEPTRLDKSKSNQPKRKSADRAIKGNTMPLKWKAPCSNCKGRSATACIICGWKVEPHKRIRDMSKSELAALNGFRNRIQFLCDIDASSMKAGNCSTNHGNMDFFLSEHRIFILDIVSQYENGRDPKDIAKDLRLTETVIKKIIRVVLDRIHRGDFEINVRHPVVPVFTPPPPEVPSQRRPLVWECEDEE